MSSVVRRAATALGAVDKVVEKKPVRLAVLTNVSNLASVSTTFGGGTIVKGDRVGLFGQSTGSQNGLYIAGAVSGGNTSLTRAADFDEGDEVGLETAVAVQAGTHAGKRYRVTATGVVGTDAITFTEMAQQLLPEAFLQVAIASAAVRTLNATPVEIIPAPGAGKFIEVISAHWMLDYGTAGYDAVAAGDDLALKYTNASGAITVESVYGVGFGDQTADQHRVVKGVAVTPALNAAVVAHMLQGEWYAAGGDSALRIGVHYRIRTAQL